MRIGIAGAGAVGCHYAAKWIMAGYPVRLLARGAHLQALQQQGLLWESEGERRRIAVQASADAAALADCDVIVLACKLTHLEGMLRQLAGHVRPDATWLTLQNGAVAPDWVAARFPASPIVAGTAFIGVRLEAPGHALHTAAGGMRIAAWNPSAAQAPRIGALLQSLQQAGVPARIEPDARRMLWRKLLWNCGFNAITAITRRFARDIAADNESCAIAQAAMHETVELARSLGIALDGEDIRKHVEVTLAMGPVKTSMWQDIERGAPTEVDYLNGHVASLARERDLAAPVNRMLTALVHAIEGEAIRR